MSADPAHTPTRRRNQDDRSRETRAKLLQATVDVLISHGYAGLTTALVDARAGVSSGARVHHYPTKTDLVVAATAYVYAQAEELGQSRALASAKSSDPIREFVKDCLSVYFDWPFIAALEVVLAARTEPQLMAGVKPVLEHFHNTMRRIWLDALVEAGFNRAQAEIDLRLTLNFVRGMAVNKIWQNDTAEYERLLDYWCHQLASHGRGGATAGGQDIVA